MSRPAFVPGYSIDCLKMSKAGENPARKLKRASTSVVTRALSAICRRLAVIARLAYSYTIAGGHRRELSLPHRRSPRLQPLSLEVSDFRFWLLSRCGVVIVRKDGKAASYSCTWTEPFVLVIH